MTGARRPLVAVTGRLVALGRVERWLEPALASPTYYSEAVIRAGGAAAVLFPDLALVEGDGAALELLSSFDGLVVTGGPDVDPPVYGQDPAPEVYDTDPDDDYFEIALLRTAIDAGLPTLAICRGHQLLNVAYGGTLDQHITDRPGLGRHGVPNGGGGAPVEVSVDAGSRLAEALDGATTCTGMCHHHQAVDRVGEGLHVVARAPDGTVEAIEPDEAPGWVVSVQWHPEDSAARDPQQQLLFNALVAAATPR